MEIQDFLIAAIQNIVILIRHSEKRRMSKSNVKAEKGGYSKKKRYSGFTQRFFRRMPGIRGVHSSLHEALCENPI